MIYVTIGSAQKGIEFTRLIKKIDDIAKDINEEIIIQLGSSKYYPKNIKYFDYCSFEKNIEYYRKAKLIIGHCGAGTIINAFKFNTPLIVVPRRFQLGEHADDHQLELARKLEGSHPLIKIIYDIDNLENTLKETLKNINDNKIIIDECSKTRKNNLILAIQDFISLVKKKKNYVF